MKWSFVFIMVSALGCSAPEAPEASVEEAFPDAPLATLKSANGALSIEIRTSPRQPPGRGISSVEYTITDQANQPKDGLELSVVPWMPAMGHGTSTKPTIEAKGEGRYVASGVTMFMSGGWELRTAITGPLKDNATVAFQIP
jgi:hypothetical protein